MSTTPLPTVGVVIPTRDRPQLMRRAVASVVGQEYAGVIETVVVHDESEVDHSIESADPRRPVRAIRNSRVPGLAGARNTGILALDTPFVAFCDDDDHWLPQKLGRQVARASEPDRPEMVTCAITVDFDGSRNNRLAGTDSVTHADLARSIMAMLHSSCMFFDRVALVDGIGLINEEIPGSQNEDWDIKLRAAARRPIAHIDEPLTVVQWGRSSMFARRWETKNDSMRYMLSQHPSIAADRRGAARVYGQLAFGEAALGHRTEALRLAAKTLRTHPMQWRGALATLVALRVVGPDQVLNLAHRFGRGV